MSQRGFTLIEMAIVLAVAGVLLGGALLAVGPLIDKARTNQTNATMDQVENALELFVIRNERLPCPADGSAAPGTANYGLEQPNTPNATCTIGAGKGVIPWRTLGIDESLSVDGWGNRLSYYAAQSGLASSTVSVTGPSSPSPPLTRSSSNPSTYMPNLSLTLGTSSFMKVIDAASGQQVTPDPANPVNSVDQAAYVLISHGKSGWYAYSKNGAKHAALIAGGNKSCNDNPGGTSCSSSFRAGTALGAYPPISNTYFDDIVRWRSPAMLIQLCGSGSCGNP